MPQANKRYLWLLLVPILIGLWLVVPKLSDGAEASQITGYYLPLALNARTATPTPTRTNTPTRTPTNTPTVTPSPTSSDGWREEYYANADLSGSPAVVRIVDYVAPEYDWGTSAPDVAGISADYFSVRFTRNVYFAAGTYDFWVTGDDSFKLYIDGVLRIDDGGHYPAGPDDETGGTASYRYRGSISVGYHAIKLEYKENLKEARIRLFWTTTDLTSKWRAEYYNNETLSGDPAVVTEVSNVNFNWGTGSPSGSISSDHFSARFTKAIWASEQRYVFYSTADDGARVYIDRWGDAWKVIDDWAGTTGFKTSGTSYLPGDVQSGGGRAAYFLVTVEYREDTGEAKCSFTMFAGGSDEYFVGEYYNKEVSSPLTNGHDWGTMTAVRLDNAINFDWGLASPISGLNIDSFSIRWTKTVWLNAGTYRFTLTVDDGALVWLDGYGKDTDLVISEWKSQQARTVTKNVTTYEGWHVVVMEYIEYTREAVAKLSWIQTSSAQ